MFDLVMLESVPMDFNYEVIDAIKQEKSKRKPCELKAKDPKKPKTHHRKKQKGCLSKREQNILATIQFYPLGVTARELYDNHEYLCENKRQMKYALDNLYFGHNKIIWEKRNNRLGNLYKPIKGCV